MRPLLLVAVLLAACSSGEKAEPGPTAFDLPAVCALADAPHATPAELKALGARAKALVTGVDRFVGTAQERRVYEAGLVISVQAVVAEKLANASGALQSAVPGIAGTLDDSLEALRDACS